MVKVHATLYGRYTFRDFRKQQRARTVTSERQKAANRANALHSTGPKTPEGKAVIRFNAFRHGLLAQDAVLPGEDEDAFEELWTRVRAELSPVGPIEEFLANRIVKDMWRLQRLVRAETALFHSRLQGVKADRLANEVRSYEKTIVDYTYLQPHIPDTDKVAHTEATEALKRARYERDRDEVLLGRAFDADAKERDAFAKLGRYERSIERSLLRNLNELRQMQDKRRNRRSSSITDAVILEANDTQGQAAG
jgi:hypothetical protein